MYKWDVQTGVTPDKLAEVLNEFDSAHYDVYQILQEVSLTEYASLTYTVIARSPKYPVVVFGD